MRAALLVAIKDLRLLARDRVALFWVVAFPLLFALLLGSVLEAAADGSRAPLELRLVDEARDPRSRALSEQFERSPALAVERADLAAARDAVRRGDAVAFVRVTPGAVELGIDPSRRAEAAAIEVLSNEALRRVASPRAPPEAGVKVLALNPGEATGSGFGLAFPAAVLWGLMGCAASFAIATVAERSGGTLLRLRAAPVSLLSILGGKALACFLACLIDCALLVAVARLALGVAIADGWGLVAAVISASACFAGITLALGAVGRSEQSVAGAGWAALVVMAMLGGAMVPLAFMPEWLRDMSPLSPVKWGITALEGAVWRGFTAAELAVPCAVLVAVGATAFLGAAALMRREEA